MDNFQDAKNAAAEMFGNSRDDGVQGTAAQMSADGDVLPANAEPTAANAANTDDGAAQNAAELTTDGTAEPQTAEPQTAEPQTAEPQTEENARAAYAALSSENANLKQRLESLEAMLEQTSKQQEEALAANAAQEQNAVQMPTLDVNALAFADEDTVKKAEAEYAEKMANYVKRGVMDELSPFVERAKEGAYQKEKNEVLKALAGVKGFEDIETALPRIDAIIENNKWLKSDDMPIEEKLINAYVIAKGANAINTPPEPPKELTDDELMRLYDSKPGFRELIEKKRIEQLKQSQQAPPLSADSGAAGAALNIKERPKTFDEASERTRKMFG